MIGVLDEAQFDECNDCDDYAITQAQELNDMLQVLEVQPGEDVPGVHMPRWLQQLRGVWMYSGLERDRQAYLAAHAIWAGELVADPHYTGADELIGVIEQSPVTTADMAATPDAVTDSDELVALRAQVLRLQRESVVIPASPATAPDPVDAVAIAPVSIAPILSMNGATISTADLAHGVADVSTQPETGTGRVVLPEPHVGTDPVGSYLYQCLQYAMVTMCLMIALTVALGLYVTWTHAFPAVESDVQVGRLNGMSRLVSTASAISGACRAVLDNASQSPDATMAIAFALGGCMWVMSSYGWTAAVRVRLSAGASRTHAAVQASGRFTLCICFMYFYLAKGDMASEGDMVVYNSLLLEHANDEWCMLHAGVASRMSEMWSQTMVMPAVHTMAELVLVAEADGCSAERALVMDTGARRSVIRDPSCFDRLTCRPAPFKVRGVLGATGQPDFMGTATVFVPASTSELGEPTHVEAVTLVD